MITIINGASTAETDPDRIVECTQIYQACRDMEEDKREAWLNGNIADGKFPHLFGDASATAEAEKVEPTPTEYLQSALQRLMDFFKEFEFEPNFRFVNTLAWMLTKKKKSCATDYIASYFELIDSPYKNEVSAKIKSKEFKAILTDMSKVATTKPVNESFKLYYGSQGTGKTTIGQTESDGR